MSDHNQSHPDLHLGNDLGVPGQPSPQTGVGGVVGPVSRRKALGGGLLAGAFFVWAAGCDSTPKAADLSDKNWLPDPSKLPPEPKDPRPVQITTPVPAYTAPVGTPPGVIPRSTWTRAGTIASLANPMNGIGRITVHHTAVVSTDIRSQADTVRMLNSVRNSHLKRGWADIGYHYAIDPQGRIWEGRPLSWQGAHVEDTNEHNLGIVMLGNFDRQSPTQASLASLDSFLVDSARRYRVPLNRIYTHRELKPTECPGTSLQRYMVATRSGSGRVRGALA